MHYSFALLLLVSVALPSMGQADESTNVKQLIADLKKQEAVKKRKTVKQLSAMGTQAREAGPVMIALLEKDRDPLIRRGAAEALGNIGADRKASIKALAKAMNDDDAEVIATASASLSKFGKDAVPVFREGLVSKDNEIRKQSAEALARIGPDAKEAVPELIKAFQTETPTPRKGNTIKATYAAALGSIGPDAKAAIPVLEAFLEQRVPDQQLRRTTQEALRKIKK